MTHPLVRLAAPLSLAVAVLAVHPAPATAQNTGGAGPGAALASAPAPTGEPKSEYVALGLTLAGTAIPWAALTVALTSDDMDEDTYHTAIVLGALGAWVGPSLGNLYAGSGHLRGFWLRTAGAGAMLVGAASTLDLNLDWCWSGDSDTGECDDDDDDDDTFATAMIGIGLGLVALGTLDDIYSAPRHVAESNAARGFGVVVAPLVRSDGGGVSLTGRW